MRRLGGSTGSTQSPCWRSWSWATSFSTAAPLELPRTGSLKLKMIHTWVGYVFAVSLLVRIVWAFLGNRYARWRAILPGGRGYLSALRSYVKSLVSRHPEQYLGHNPLGRLSMTAMLVLIIILAVSGLVLAGTDLFYPPIGHWIRALGGSARDRSRNARGQRTRHGRQSGVRQHASIPKAVYR